ncbi:asparagine synthase (glutamine-hydrolyzing) [Thermoanaerobacterium thermosaccharolyticum]|uniref:asparagine synthase (glutamine-hydrolyzing) n=1 Tax=Thermoanaerobacterium thermosaccharolyticum TaxID=1517 RepID=UPI00104E96AC|nr:asparagine synthase (glutamine-hydrolyzing) [Thermoanaerobacterium thermosaccharolyticum]KAA5808001.1 asparagine synthase (glutamine-hydrolyzing) [Thermoanaerobacterium thermosaccharolyticum]TCW34826.1 asparagine synthase (glutamine-hydrolysing) [Thermohydrogenium kirishiense]
MCGICGFSGDMANYLGENNLREMLDIIIHRGPDDEGTYFKNYTALGMRRLSIIDLKSGHQPIHNEEKDIYVVFNGEIYNFQSLRTDMIIKGHKFYTSSDTEVIVHLYEEYGDEFVSYLNGMFAICIWDEKNRKLLLARDRLGIKPLYYTFKNNTIVFGSEIKSLLKCKIVDAELNYSKIGALLSYRYVPGTETMFKDIFEVMPGNILIYSNKKFKIKKYWDIEFKDNPDIGEEFYYANKTLTLIDSSISKRIVSDVPIGIFLSGGLDSTIILSEVSKFYDKTIKTFSVGFEKPKSKTDINDYSELALSKRTANYYGTEHYEFIIKPDDVINDIKNIIWYMDEPLSDPTAIPLYYLSKFAKNYVKVVLSGEGADEIFAGYTVYKEPYAVNKYNQMPKFLKDLIESLSSRMPTNFGKDFLRRAKLPISKRYRGVGMTFKDDEISTLLSGDLYALWLKDMKNDKYLNSFYHMPQWKDEVSQMLYFDQKVWLPKDVLIKSDKMTMANSIELRVPFLDYRIVEFASSIPSSLKYRGNNEKYILKKAFKDTLPSFVLNRKKNGFPVPLSSLLNLEFKNFAKDILLSQKSLSRGYFNKQYIENLFKKYNSTSYKGRQIWLLLTFELWNRIFIDSSNASLDEEMSVI